MIAASYQLTQLWLWMRYFLNEQTNQPTNTHTHFVYLPSLVNRFHVMSHESRLAIDRHIYTHDDGILITILSTDAINSRAALAFVRNIVAIWNAVNSTIQLCIYYYWIRIITGNNHDNWFRFIDCLPFAVYILCNRLSRCEKLWEHECDLFAIGQNRCVFDCLLVLCVSTSIHCSRDNIGIKCVRFSQSKLDFAQHSWQMDDMNIYKDFHGINYFSVISIFAEGNGSDIFFFISL